MLNKTKWLVVLALLTSLVLVACGSGSTEEIIQDAAEQVSEVAEQVGENAEEIAETAEEVVEGERAAEDGVVDQALLLSHLVCEGLLLFFGFALDLLKVVIVYFVKVQMDELLVGLKEAYSTDQEDVF